MPRCYAAGVSTAAGPYARLALAAPFHTGEKMQATELPPDLPEHAAEMALWASALRLFIEDAQRYWQGKAELGLDLEQAFDDLCRCGVMTRYLCGFLDLNPAWVSEQFILKCEAMA